MNHQIYESLLFCSATRNKNLILLLLEITDASLDRPDENQCSSACLKINRSININHEHVNGRNNNDDNQQSSSDDEDCFDHYTIPSSTLSTSQIYSPMMVQNESLETLPIDKFHNDSKAKGTNELYVSKTSSSAQQPEYEFDASGESQEARRTVKRKRNINLSSSSPKTNIKQSARFAAKRVRLV